MKNAFGGAEGRKVLLRFFAGIKKFRVQAFMNVLQLSIGRFFKAGRIFKIGRSFKAERLFKAERIFL